MPKKNCDVKEFAVRFNLQSEAIVLLIKIGVLPRKLAKFDNFELLKRIRDIWHNEIFIKWSLSSLSESSRRPMTVRKKDNVPEWQSYVEKCCEQFYSQGLTKVEIETRMQEIVGEVGTLFNVSTDNAVKKKIKSIRRSVAKRYYRQKNLEHV